MEHVEGVSGRLAVVIRNRLAQEQISLRAATEKTGIPLTTLSRRMNGTSPLSVIELAGLASLLGTTPSELVTAAESDNWGAA